MGMQFYAWLFVPSYNEQINRGYLPRKNNEAFMIPTTDFLPTVLIMTFDVTTLEILYAGKDYWEISWIQ